uniref:DDE-1 domain-containing protein n=1 Tax=Acrobeloides nanus TaxID=290746 RepID=A0A914BWX2_9BILA
MASTMALYNLLNLITLPTLKELNDDYATVNTNYKSLLPNLFNKNYDKYQPPNVPIEINTYLLVDHIESVQDGAPSHKAIETQDLIKDSFPEAIEVDISPKRDNGDWPQNSPDLNVLDYSLWSILENEACSKPHQSIEALKKSLVAAWNKIPEYLVKLYTSFQGPFMQTVVKSQEASTEEELQ